LDIIANVILKAGSREVGESSSTVKMTDRPPVKNEPEML
jgi:hypothetical protein